MKKVFIIIVTIFLVSSCNNNGVEKPKNLIDEDKMEDIIYDLAVLDGIRTQSYSNQFDVPTANELLKSKYKVDSLTFAQNTQYYASDIDNFKHLYDRVKNRLTEENNIIKAKDSMQKALVPQVQKDEPRQTKIEEPGIVK